MDPEDGSIVYELYQVARTASWSETYSGTGNLSVNLSELRFVDSADHDQAVTIEGNYQQVNKIRAGSKVQIVISSNWNSSESLDVYNNTFDVTGGTVVLNRREKVGPGEKYKRTIVVDNVNSVLKLKGGLKASNNNNISIQVTVLGEWTPGPVPTGDALTANPIAEVTMTRDNVSVDWDEDFANSSIKIKPDKGHWTSIISSLPDTGENGTTYTYYVKEKSISSDDFEPMGDMETAGNVENNNVANGNVVSVKLPVSFVRINLHL